MQTFLAAFALFIALDLVWFQFMGKFFLGEVGQIARVHADGTWNVRYIPAILAYVLMAVGIVFLVMPQSTSLGTALFFGGLFGLVGYGLYDLTNLATLSAWTVKLALVDMAWGTFLSGVVSASVYSLSRLA
jgi:uncharacterized membrane protein